MNPNVFLNYSEARLLLNPPKCPNNHGFCQMDGNSFTCPKRCSSFPHLFTIMNPTYNPVFVPRKEPQGAENPFPLWRPPNLTIERNNITDFEFYRKGNLYTKNTPYFIRTSLPLANNSTSEIVNFVIENEDHLPLMRRESSIEGAGQGIFTTSLIQANTLISVYTGDVGPHWEVRDSDSIFDLGVLRVEQSYCYFQLDGRNSCRFVNSKPEQEANCQMFKGLFICGNRAEVYLALVTKKTISSGKELFYDYGQNFEMKKIEPEPLSNTKIQGHQDLESLKKPVIIIE